MGKVNEDFFGAGSPSTSPQEGAEPTYFQEEVQNQITPGGTVSDNYFGVSPIPGQVRSGEMPVEEWESTVLAEHDMATVPPPGYYEAVEKQYGDMYRDHPIASASLKALAIGGEGTRQLAQGVTQMWKDYFSSEEDYAEYTRAVEASRAEMAGVPLFQGPGENAALLFGKIVPTMLTPGGPGKNMAGIWGALYRSAYGAASGAAWGAAEFAAEGHSRLQNAIWGGALGGGVAAIAEVPKLGLNYWGGKLQRAYKHERAVNEALATDNPWLKPPPKLDLEEVMLMKAAKEADTLEETLKRLDKNFDVPLDAMQHTGDPEVAEMVMTLRNSPGTMSQTLAFSNKQTRALRNNLSITLGKLGKSLDEGQVGGNIRAAYKTTIDSLDDLRQGRWQLGMAEVSKEAGKGWRIPLGNYKNSLKEWVKNESAGGRFTPPQSTANKTSKVLNDFLEAAQKSGKDPSIDDFMALHKEMTRLADSGKMLGSDVDDRLAKKIAGDLKSALQKDLDSAVEQGLSPNLVNKYRAIRVQYAADSEARRAIQESVIGKLLSPGKKTEPAKFYDTMMNMTKGELKTAVKILDDYDPVLMHGVRRRTIERAIQAAQAGPVPRDLPTRDMFDLQKFVKALPDGERFDEIFGNTVTKKELQLHLKYIQRLMITGAGGSHLSSAAMAQDISGLAIQAPQAMQGKAQGALPFVGRYTAKWLAPKIAADVLLAPEARAAARDLIHYGPRNLNPNKMTAATLVLWAHMDQTFEQMGLYNSAKEEENAK